MAAPSGIVTVREAVIDLLRGFGMTSVFANPGSTELPMFRDFPSGFRYVLGLQEAVVVGMADGFGSGDRIAETLREVERRACTGRGRPAGDRTRLLHRDAAA